jgi:prolyl 4-hydroxylase
MHIADGIFTLDAVLNQAECEHYIQLTEGVGFEAATITTLSGQFEMRPSVRNNDRVIVDDAALGASLWARVRERIPATFRGQEAIGLNERFRYYRYTPGQRFRLHADGAFRRDNGEASLLTMMIYLNAGFTGGETKFREHIVTPQAGMALFFDHRLLHEGAEVLSGVKYVMRTDVMFSASN